MNTSFEKKILEINNSILTDHPLKEFTTFNIGGPADYIIVAESTDQMTESIKTCLDFEIPLKILGGGSNILVSENGFQGAVIINKCSEWKVLDDNNFNYSQPSSPKARLTTVGSEFYSTDGLEYSDKGAERIKITVSSGTRLIPFIKILFKNKITGLQWFSGIPASIGGAIYMNIHGGNYFFGDFVHSAILFNGQDTKRVDQNYFKFNYDWSILHKTKEIILEAELNLFKGDVEKAKELSKTWARRKSLQPQMSVGCVFCNLTESERKRLDLPTSSIGYLIDKVLGLKGMRKGGAVISSKHAAFIENKDNASANDVYYLYKKIIEKAQKKLELDLIPEIEFIGDFK